MLLAAGQISLYTLSYQTLCLLVGLPSRDVDRQRRRCRHICQTVDIIKHNTVKRFCRLISWHPLLINEAFRLAQQRNIFAKYVKKITNNVLMNFLWNFYLGLRELRF